MALRMLSLTFLGFLSSTFFSTAFPFPLFNSGMLSLLVAEPSVILTDCSAVPSAHAFFVGGGGDTLLLSVAESSAMFILWDRPRLTATSSAKSAMANERARGFGAAFGA